MVHRRHAAILFVDISDSTRLYEKLGDAEATARARECLRVLQEATGESAGQMVKSMGDGLMCAFESADSALHAARTMQIRVSEQTANCTPAIGIHIGCHFGPVVESDGDVFGDCVNVASRVAELAKVGQVITTQETVARLSDPLRNQVRRLDEVAVKGRREPLEIFELIWQDSVELTLLATQMPAERATELRLVFSGRELLFNASGNDTVVLGRGSDCDATIADAKISRRHAVIERRGDNFILADQSANGTFVRFADESEVGLHREDLMLRGHGEIRLGRRTGDAKATVIQFFCE